MQRILTVCAALAATASYAQDVCGFLDYRNYFFVFDKGTIKQIEHQAPIAYATGGGYLVYAAMGGTVKVYRDGTITEIDQGIAARPTVTDHYFGYVSAGVLKIYDGRELRTLSRNAAASVVEDSIAGYYDDMQRTMNVHYRGVTTQVEDALIENPLQRWSAGNNTIAWVTTNTKELKVFQHGEVNVIAAYADGFPFTAGLDVVAYQDPLDQGLKAYYKGEVIDVDAFMPEKIHMGRGLFAYVDKSGALKVFQGGKVFTALDFTPDEFFVKDSLVVINDKNYCKVFHDGSTATIVPYWPKRWAARWGTFVWLDNDNSLQRWTAAGVMQMMQRQPVKDFSFERGLIKAVLQNNAVKILWKDQVYDH